MRIAVVAATKEADVARLSLLALLLFVLSYCIDIRRRRRCRRRSRNRKRGRDRNRRRNGCIRIYKRIRICM